MTTPSWGREDPRNGVPPWMWPVVIDARQRETGERETTPAKPVRIGDAERDEAVSTLGDHFAAGRLTRDELDERIDQAMQAKFSTDLEPLFADLPRPDREPVPSGPRQRRPHPPSPVLLLVPLLVIGLVVTAISFGNPWMLWGLVWLAMLGRFWGGRGRGPYGPHAHRPGPPAHHH